MTTTPDADNRAALEAHQATLVRLLAGQGEGWPIVDILGWLLSTAQALTPAELVQGLGERLNAAGAPVWRIRISIRTLDPQVLAHGFTWRRGHAVSVARIEHEIETSDAYADSPIQHVLREGTAYRCRLDALDPQRDHAVLHELAADGGIDYLAQPIRFGDRMGGAIIFVTERHSGFTEDDLSKLVAVTDALTPLLNVASMRDVARSLLDTYVGPRTGERVLSGQIRRGDGEIIEAAMWFSDLRDFTPLTESLPARELLAMLNAYFELVAAAVTSRGGEILRFIGDAMLIVFPTGSRVSQRSACQSALDGALDAFAGLDALNHRRRRSDQPELRFGVGLHVGSAIYGNVGAPNRLDFTVMGPAVNRTARLESLTKKLGTSLLASAEFAENVAAPMRSLGHHAMKGVREPQEVFALSEAS